MNVLLKLKSHYLSSFPAEAAGQLAKCSNEEIINLTMTLSLTDIEPALSKLHPDRLVEISGMLTIGYFVNLLSKMRAEKVTQVLYGLGENKKNQVLKKLPSKLQKDIEEIMKYPSGTAGYMMDPHVLMLNQNMTAKEAIQKLKARNNRNIRVLFLVNEQDKLESMVTIQQLVMADEQTKLESICQKIPCVVKDMTPQDEIVSLFEECKMIDLPVVDIHGHFIGVVRYDSLIQATKEELTKDIQTMVGVSEDERALSKVTFAVKKRFPWLEINLLTAFIAAGVVALFESTIAQFTALAVLLPVVAGQSGNTGAQALAVTMRGLALKEIRTSQWMLIVFKELKISLLTGVAVSITTALGVLVWSKSLGLTLIIGISMLLSMVLASVSGAAVPIILTRLGQDPASSSSILLTTVTDVCGFFSFLGIATLLSNLI